MATTTHRLPRIREPRSAHASSQDTLSARYPTRARALTMAALTLAFLGWLNESWLVLKCAASLSSVPIVRERLYPRPHRPGAPPGSDNTLWRFAPREVNPHTSRSGVLREPWVRLGTDCHDEARRGAG
jgi:hypothetical protein